VKPSAASRTLDIFSGKTKQEEQDEALRVRTNADVRESEKSKETIEEAADRWRAAAFVGQEWTCQHFGKPDHSGRKYRLSLKDGWLYLEWQDTADKGKNAYHYGGLMLPEEAVVELANVIVQAAREYKSRIQGSKG
jgi:hypothetical protein